MTSHADFQFQDINVFDAEHEESMREVASSSSTEQARREVLAAKKIDKASSLELATIKYVPNGYTPLIAVESPFRYKYIWADVRNYQTRKKLLQKYNNKMQDRNLHAFCVGNQDYGGHGYNFSQSRNFLVEKSGIPELRRFCHSIIARAQFRADKHFLDTETPNLILSFSLWD